jgi:hypothetical protein
MSAKTPLFAKILMAEETYRRRLDVDGTLAVEDKVEQAAVRIVALELGLEGSGEVEGLRGSNEAGLDIIGLLSHGQGVDLLELGAIFVLDLLLVVGNKGLLLNVAVVVHGADLALAVLVTAHIVGMPCLQS